MYSTDPDASRAFFRDKLRLPGSDLGVYPTMEPSDAGQHDISFYCDEIHGTVA